MTYEKTNSHYLVQYDFRVEVCDASTFWSRGYGWSGGAPSAMLELVTAIDGIVAIQASGYQMILFKGRRFAWDEILPAVEATFVALPPQRGKE